MEVHIPLESMTTAEKLRVLEEIWEDLRRTPEEVPSPSWHADVLEARQRRIRQRSAPVQHWDEAKRSARERSQ